jgi:hypothetical protein
MSTPLYTFLKGSINSQNLSTNLAGYSTYIFPSSAEDISLAYQNDNYTMNFSKFALLNINLPEMLKNMEDLNIFNTESTDVITDNGDLLVNHLRNYVANQDVVIRESLLNNNTNFYNPQEVRTTTERIFWKWLRKTGAIQFEPAVPNEEYIDGQDFAINTNLPTDYFKEYVWKERDVITYTINNIIQQTFDNSIIDPFDNIGKNIYQITVSTSSTIKPNDRITITSQGNINIGFNGSMGFTVFSIATNTFNNTVSNKNNVINILSDTQLIWNNFAVATLALDYEKVLKYIGEISAVNNVQNGDRSYTEITAYIPDQNGETPDILFRVYSDSNYSPSLQYPILPSQEQPEIVGAENPNSPINTMPNNYPGDQYAYFDTDQVYLNSNGLQDRKSGDYYGVLDSNRTDARVASAPYVYPEFDGVNLDGVTVDFDLTHYVKANLPNQLSGDFDTFDGQTFNNLPPNDFEFNVILWYYQIEDKTLENITDSTSSGVVNTSTTTTTTTTNVVTRQVNKVNQDAQIGMNLYGITILNPLDPATKNIDSYQKLVSNGKQDGLSYIFNLNLNFNINNDNTVESFDPDKVYSQFGFDLYNTVMRKVSYTNDIYMKLNTDVANLIQNVNNLKTLLYTQTDINTINASITALYTLLNTYQRNQIMNSDSISVVLNQSTSPPSIQLNSIDARYGSIVKYPIELLYNNSSNTVLNNRITVPQGKDFLIIVENDDNTNVVLDNTLNIVLDRDLDYKQTCEIKIYPNNATYNKKLNVSINTTLVNNVDPARGYQLINNLDLPIDNNLNPNIQYQGISTRWNDFSVIYPQTIGMKQIAGFYYLVIGIEPLKINSFNSGDVLYLENFQLVKTDNIATPIIADISGQYTITGDITNNELTFLVSDQNFISLFTALRKTNTSPTIYLNSINVGMPAFLRINTGWYITITATDTVATDIGDNYLIEIKPLKKEDL